jgi:SAM-dependent methyltransferase
MFPAQYLKYLACPRCRGDLVTGSAAKLACLACGHDYPVVDGMPILRIEDADAVSRSVDAFYAAAWKRDREGRLRGKVIHEDLTRHGQQYIDRTEERFGAWFGGSGEVFLDAACGAQPRVEFGRSFRHHLCIDFSLDGLHEARQRIGARAICVCGSLLNLPIKPASCDGVLASHCVYHIAAENQLHALAELARVLAPGGRMLILYANPQARLIRHPIMRLARNLLGRLPRPAPPVVQSGEAVVPETTPLYTFLHPIDVISAALESAGLRSEVRSLCLLTREETEAAFRVPVLRSIWYAAAMALERLLHHRPSWSYFVAYLAERTSAGTMARQRAA